MMLSEIDMERFKKIVYTNETFVPDLKFLLTKGI